MPPLWQFWKANEKSSSLKPQTSKKPHPSNHKREPTDVCNLELGVSLKLEVWSLRLFLRPHHAQRPVEHRHAHHLSPIDVRPVSRASGRKEKCARCVRHTGFLPFPGQHVNKLVCFRMNVGGYRHTCVEFAKNRYTPGLFVFMQQHQFDTGVRAALPFFVFCKRNIREHASIEQLPAKNCNTRVVQP